jgi:hypothetical protein
MAIRDQGDTAAEGDSSTQSAKIVYVIHPNCSFEEF